MKLRKLLLEVQEKSITFVDIDETLFNTNAKIHVIKDGKILKKLHNTEFNTYVLQDGESFDFIEFVSSDIFVNTSEPITAMVKKLRAMFKNIKASGSDMYLLTARADFDDKDKFLNFLKSYGIPVGHVNNGEIHVIRAGNTPGKGGSDIKKKIIIKKFLDTGKYYKVRLYDDALSNLNAFLELKEEFPDVQFEAFEVNHGIIRPYKKGTNKNET